MRDQQMITAYHEAGHAVMAMSCGFHVGRISIRPNDSNLGHVAYGLPEELTPEIRRKDVLVCCAGLAADAIHSRLWSQENEVLDEADPMGYLEDQRRGRDHLPMIGGDETFEDYLALTMWYLRSPERWKIVEEIVFFLLGAGAIDGAVLIRKWAEQCPPLTDDQIKQHLAFLTRPAGAVQDVPPFAG